MHILFLIRERNIPGTAIQNAAVMDAEFLRSEGHEATVLSLCPEANIKAQIAEGLRKHRGQTVLSFGRIEPSKFHTLVIDRMEKAQAGLHIVQPETKTEPHRVLRIERVIDEGPKMKLICSEVTE